MVSLSSRTVRRPRRVAASATRFGVDAAGGVTPWLSREARQRCAFDRFPFALECDSFGVKGIAPSLLR